MPISSLPKPAKDLRMLGIGSGGKIHDQLSPWELIEQTLDRGQGELSDTGALVVHTGSFTGRSPKDRFIVKDDLTAGCMDWNDFNLPISASYFDLLYRKVIHFLSSKEIWVRDGWVGVDPQYRLNIRCITQTPWANLFCYNMFLRPDPGEQESRKPDWTLLHAPGCLANPAIEGTRQSNFTILDFTRKILLIGGSAYTGEIKKGIFSVLNFWLPHQHQVLGIHGSANMGLNGDTALFFGLSGTGKTTLSTDPARKLIGDDEHGWSDRGIFNFEGGCYAKCIDLNPNQEPQIYQAIREGALLENVRFFPGTWRVNYRDRSITENTRVSYPLFYIDQALDPAMAGHPKNIFFLTCDAYGILPPISRLNPGQAMYQFLSGYTARVAGTETDITEPKATFSTCFGAPFMPLHPFIYAKMLGEKIKRHRVQCWLINTGWSAGPYGMGKRIPLSSTRAMIQAALEGKLEEVEWSSLEIFNLAIPRHCPGVPSGLLHPKNTWADPQEYVRKARDLAQAFILNFKKFQTFDDPDLMTAAPQI
ncbi:MAG: phosphoenolpyruvate carboxykinase (ATP) [Chitinophagaceae bacterium]